MHSIKKNIQQEEEDKNTYENRCFIFLSIMIIFNYNRGKNMEEDLIKEETKKDNILIIVGIIILVIIAVVIVFYKLNKNNTKKANSNTVTISDDISTTLDDTQIDKNTEKKGNTVYIYAKGYADIAPIAFTYDCKSENCEIITTEKGIILYDDNNVKYRELTQYEYEQIYNQEISPSGEKLDSGDFKKIEPYKKLLRFLAMMIVVIAVTLIFVMFWRDNYNEGIVFPFYYKGHWLVGAFYAFFFLTFSHIYGGMSYGYLKNTNIIFSQILALLCTNIVIYLEIVLLSARFVKVVPMFELTVIEAAFLSISTCIIDRLFKTLFPPHKITVLYQEYDPSELLRKVKTRKDRYRIQETVDVNREWDELICIIDKCESILVYDVHSELRNKIVKYCYEKDIRLYVTPKISDILIRSSDNIHLFDTPLMLLRNNGLNFEQRILKRLLDVIVSLVVIIVTSPIMAIIALAIKLYDGGPVFFKQKRCTLDGKVFEIHKFRSMIVDAEKEGISIPATDKDPRITPVGNVIRMTRLDELPQVFDILIGNMSIVGPRPERVEHVEKYTKEVPEFAYRLKVKGGLTGYAQIYGKYNTTAYDKLRLDLMYIENYSLMLDIKLILMTIRVMFSKDSTEGIDVAKENENLKQELLEEIRQENSDTPEK